jgi:murein DD-endopeptidase MepM/ murein hydrolase activator NlpD
LFKNYHIVIFKDRESGFRNLRLRGWFGVLLFLVLAGLAGGNLYLWEFQRQATSLEHDLEEARRQIRANDNQILSLTGKLQALEQDILRVQQFDSKLRVLMNVDKDPADTRFDETEMDAPNPPAGSLNNPLFLSRHRELFVRRLHGLVDELSTNVRLEEVEQQTLFALLRVNKDSLLSTPSIWPVKGYLTSGFGPRRAPLSGATRIHKGLDISNRIGLPIRATARGAVTFSGPDGAYGICVTIDHGNGLVTRYAHMQRALVKVGDYVQRGDVIGALGNSGRSTGPHLHYEVIVNGVQVNPMRYILN